MKINDDHLAPLRKMQLPPRPQPCCIDKAHSVRRGAPAERSTPQGAIKVTHPKQMGFLQGVDLQPVWGWRRRSKGDTQLLRRWRASGPRGPCKLSSETAAGPGWRATCRQRWDAAADPRCARCVAVWVRKPGSQVTLTPYTCFNLGLQEHHLLL